MRSAAIVYCVRSLVPMETKSRWGIILSAIRAAAGTSIMAPATSPRSAHSPANHLASRAVATMGAMTHVGAFSSRPSSLTALAIASSWRVSNGSLARATRRPRTPRAGFISSAMVAKATGLSEPASRDRTTTLELGNLSRTFLYTSACSSTEGSSSAERKHISVRNKPIPSACVSDAMRAALPS